MSDIELYFMNENYQKVTDLLVPKHNFNNLFLNYIELSVEKPLKYETMTLSSQFRKTFYDSDAIYVSEEVYQQVFSSNISNIYCVPVNIKFADGKSFSYYRIDSKLELDIIDMDNSVTDEDGDLSRVIFDTKKVSNIDPKNLDFFKLSGLDAFQFVVSKRVKENLVKYSNDIDFKIDKEFDLLW
ncbi:hypothetical protein F0266_08475 [Vibrio coralliilyticus]|uniref:Uncharacterized protein n=1 Tax=Vibrio coralliilyticus TaxID=190893 RepID=A0AAP6ZMU8_9VIBR|nr:hypothetical protein [Vibrio coralliilyticus]NOH52966.1 hypothetical protein [Vibrio coralliilyticus]NOJ22305.1 hypothetical protein [Vibrio coralliilyticus]